MNAGTPPQTINELFNQAMRERAKLAVMRYKRDKRWHDITRAQLDDGMRNLALALHRLGVRAGDLLALLAESSPEWSITDYAILANGAINVPIYPTQAVDQVGYILRNSGARILFISNAKQLRRIQPALDSIKSKERPQLIMFEAPREGKEEKKDGAVTILADLEKAGREERSPKPQLYEQLSAQSQPDDLATIIYTSGPT